MKKSTLLLVFFNLMFTILVNAQSLSQHSNAYLISGNSSTLAEAHVNIINTGSSTLSVKAFRNNISVNLPCYTYFCWGTTCYPSGTSLSSTSQSISPGGTDSSFVGYFDPSGITGISAVSYTFFDENNPADSVAITFAYSITPTGINDLPTKATVSGAYPNPADGITALSYNLNSSKDARLVFYNMLGSAIKEIKLSDRQSTLIISTSDFKSGIYFYSLVADGKSLASKKLVVAHR